ncbi:hypothetical protein ABPG75_008561 [Micractinium tetrahymenae]
MSLQHDRGANKLIDTPCGEAYTNSLKCLDKNNYDKKKCQAEFEAYKKCKKDALVAERAERLASRKGFFS